MKNRSMEGWTLVAVWITAALTIWFLASIADDVDRWMNAHQHLSGWAQALGGFLAIVAAWLFGRIQMNAAVAVERERERKEALQHLLMAHLAFSHLLADTERMNEINLAEHRAFDELVRTAGQAVNDLELIVLHELPPVLSHQVSTAKAMLLRFAAMIERKTRFSPTEFAAMKEDVNLIGRVATRARNMAWATISRTMTSEELAEENASRAALRAHREAAEGRPVLDGG